MSHDTTIAEQVQQDSTFADVNATGTPPAPPSDELTEALANPDPATAAKMAKDDAGIARIVELAIATLDPKDMLKKYAKLGGAVFNHAVWQKNQFARWEEKDWTKLCDKTAQQVKFQVAIKDVDMAKFARIYLWVEAVRPLVPDVDKLSYFQVANKFLPTLKFSPTDLAGEIKKGWIDFVKDTVARQVSDNPMTIKELDEAIAAHKKRLEDDANAKKSPEKLMEAEHRAQVAKKAKVENDLRTKLTTAVDEALGGVLSPTQVVDLINKVAKDRKVDLPVGDFDRIANMSPQEAKLLAKAMWDLGNIAAMKVLRDQLDMMVKTFENAAIQTKTA